MNTVLAAIVGPALCLAAYAQTPPAQPPPQSQQQAPRGTEGAAHVPLPGTEPILSPLRRATSEPPFPGVPSGAVAAPVALTLAEAVTRAGNYAGMVYSAEIAAHLAHEDKVQARAAMLPSITGFNQFIYTQPNGTPSGVFVSNDGPHVYNQQAIVHGDIYAPTLIADYHKFTAAEAVANARRDIALRGLIATVTQDYYGVVTAERKLANAQQTLAEARSFLDITQKQERGGEVAHADVIKAEIGVDGRQRELQNSLTILDQARITLGVLVFPYYGQVFSVIDDLEKAVTLPPFNEVQAMAAKNNPDLRAALATVDQQKYELASTRAALYPRLSFDYFFGLNANQYAVYDPEHHELVGNVAQAQLTIPIWTWGAARSRVHQSQWRLEQAKRDLTLTQRTVVGELHSFYEEADTAAMQLASLRHSEDLAAESLKLTIARYEAGEATALEVVDAQSTLAAARNAYDDGLLRYRMALANLQTLSGVF